MRICALVFEIAMEKFIIRHRSKDQTVRFITSSVFLIAGIFAFSVKAVFAGALMCLGLLGFLSYQSGFEFNTRNNTYRAFYSLYGIKKDRWINYANFTSISIKKKRKGMQQYAPRSNNSSVSYTTYYEVIMVRKDNRNYKTLFASRDFEETKNLAATCCEKLHLPYTQFGK